MRHRRRCAGRGEPPWRAPWQCRRPSGRYGSCGMGTPAARRPTVWPDRPGPNPARAGNLHARGRSRLTVISNSRDVRSLHLAPPISRRVREWDGTRTSAGSSSTTSAYPVSLNPFTFAKRSIGWRPLLLGLPVVADIIPSYEELRPFAQFGDWSEGLWDYAADAARHRRHVRAGRQHLRGKYTPSRVVDQWSRVLRPLAA